MNIVIYILIFVAVCCVSAAVFVFASRSSAPIESKTWMIGRATWVVYALAAGTVAWQLELTFWVGALLGFAGAFIGVIVAFGYSMCKTKRGLH